MLLLSHSCRMPESLGTRLRHRRERQQISLTTVADQTKIKISLLEALERDDTSYWPSGIFRRAFVRAYAEAIGLEPDVVVREFLELHPDPIEVVETPAAVGTGSGLRTAGRERLQSLARSANDLLSRLRPRTPQDVQTTAPVQQMRGQDVIEAQHVQSVATPDAPATPALAAEPVAASPAEPVAEDAAGGTDDAASALDESVARTDGPGEPDLLTAAHLCTEFSRIEELGEAALFLEKLATAVDASGVIVWIWDAQAQELRPVLAHGYSIRVLAQLPRVEREADNATAAAFRASQTCVVIGNERASGALVVPLMRSTGCIGVLAIELQHGRERNDAVLALVTICASQLARLVRPAGDRYSVESVKWGVQS